MILNYYYFEYKFQEREFTKISNIKDLNSKICFVLTRRRFINDVFVRSVYCDELCECFRMNIDEYDWNKFDGWVWRDTKRVHLNCGYEHCIYRSDFFRNSVLSYLLKKNYTWSILYVREKFENIPPEYLHTIVSFFSEKSWMKILEATGRSVLRICSSVIRKIYYFIEDNLPFFTAFLGTLAVVFGAVGGIIYLNEAYPPPPQEIKIVSQLQGSWKESAYGHNIGKAPNAKRTPKIPCTKQGLSQQYTVAIDRVRRNFFTITVLFDGKECSFRLLGLRKREALIIRHFDEEIRSVNEGTVYGKPSFMIDKQNKYGLLFDYHRCPIKWYSYGKDNDFVHDSNIGIIELPTRFPEFKDITKFIAGASDHMYVEGFGTMVVDSVVYENMLIKRSTSVTPYVISATDETSSVSMDNVYTYTKRGEGLCGSVLISPNMQRPIIGIHVAGTTEGQGAGISEVIMSEMFENVKSYNEPRYTEYVEPKFEPINLDGIDIETAIYPYGNAQGIYIQHQSGKSSIIPSKIHGCVPVTQEPNPLGPNDKRLPKGCNPLYKGVEHKGRVPYDFDEKVLDLCANDLFDTFKTNIIPIRSRVGIIDMTTAIIGNPNIEGFEKLEFSTSAGYPLQSTKPSCAPGKRWLFTLEEKNNQLVLKDIHKELKRLYDLEMTLRVKGIKPFTVFVDCLKDTTLPIEKCKIPGKTRIFSISPVQFTIAFKQYCLDFMASYQRARLDAEHAIGINPMSTQWHALAQHLLGNSTNIVTGDYTNFGPSLMRMCVVKACDIIVGWYKFHGVDDEHIRVLTIMLDEITDAYYLCGSLFYKTACGIPSGSPITAPLNSMVNSLYLRYAYALCVDYNFKVMRESVKIVTYGDDVIMSVDDSLIHKFNAVTIGNILAKYNIKFTDQDKQGELIYKRNINSATFLKRSFVKHPNKKIWIGPLDKNSVENPINWIHKGNDTNENTIDNCKVALENAVEWGPVYYNYLADKVRYALQQHGLKISFESWQYWDNERYGFK